MLTTVPAIGRKRIRTHEEEDGNANEKRRIHQEEAGQKELNQESDKIEDGKTDGDPNKGRKNTHQDDENGYKEEFIQNGGWGYNCCGSRIYRE